MILACPQRRDLERLILGQTSDVEADRLEKHLEHCGPCLETVRSLQTQDELVDALRSGPTAAASIRDGSEDALFQRLRSLHSDQTAPSIKATRDVTSMLSAAQADDEIGRLGSYRVLELLGVGGMGVVFRAEDTVLSRQVALKVILDAHQADARYQARFQAEATALARLQHPNIVQIHEIGQHQGRPYFALEYVPGGTLAEYLANHSQAPRDCAVLVRTLALAVQYAHDQGVVHRDLKPANILLQRSEVKSQKSEIASPQPASSDLCLLTSNLWPKIADFGLAHRLDELGLTQTGEFFGTPSYMAPEMTRGAGPNVGPAVDIYALGAILYEALTDRPPFRGETVLETLDQVRTLDPIPPHRLQPRVPRDLETISLKCLHKDATKRYATARALAEDLTRYLEGRPILARPAGPLERLRKAGRRRPALAVLVGLSALGGVGTVAGVLYHNVELRAQVERADGETARAIKEKERADDQYHNAWTTLIRMLEAFNKEGTGAIPQVVELQRAQSEHALAFFESVLAGQEDPQPRQQADLAAASKEAARLQMTLGRSAPAEQNLRRAIRILEELDVEATGNPDQLRTLAGSLDLLGVLLGSQPSRGGEAVSCGRKAVELLERLVRDGGNDAHLRYNLAQACDNLGTLYRTIPSGSVLEWYERSLSLLRELHREQPEHVDFGVSLAQTCSNIGPVYEHANQKNKASAAYQEALRILEPLAKANPSHVGYTTSLAALRINLAGLLQTQGREKEALQQYTLTLEALQDVLRREPNHAQAHQHLLPAHGGRAQTLSRLGRPAEALKDWDCVVELGAETERANYRLMRAEVLIAAGNPTKAAAEADDVAGAGTAAAVHLYEAGRLQAQIAATIRNDPNQAGKHADRALFWLQKAQAAGFFKQPDHAAYLKTAEYSAVQKRADFQKLLHEVREALPKSAKP